MAKKKGDNYMAEVECFNCKFENEVKVDKNSIVKDHIRRVACLCANCGQRLK